MKLLIGLVLIIGLSGCAENRFPDMEGPTGSPGPTGSQGVPGPTGAASSIEVIVPCPTLVGAYPEVLWRLDGILYAVYSSGSKIHLTELTAGNYVTTDGRGCNFTVNTDGSVN